MRARNRRRWLRRLEIMFWAAAVVFLGCYAAVYMDRNLYQAYQEWSFDRHLSREPAPVIGFVLHSLRFGTGEEERVSTENPSELRDLRAPAPVPPPERLEPGAVIGRIEMPRLRVHAIVVESTREECLRRAVGHIEGTALPGQTGNVGLAGHRDTFFRGLQHVRKGDTIRLTTLEGTYRYVVAGTRIVQPGDVEVLQASTRPELTLVTCYPFHYVGAAPRRFIVRAEMVSGGPGKQAPAAAQAAALQ